MQQDFILSNPVDYEHRSLRHAMSGLTYPTFCRFWQSSPTMPILSSRLRARSFVMCRNIRTLFNFEPPASDDEIRASALQFVRKISGFTHPSKVNEAAFNRAVDEVTASARTLLASLATAQPPRDRVIEANKARARARARYA
jgi:hypothetical protein